MKILNKLQRIVIVSFMYLLMFFVFSCADTNNDLSISRPKEPANKTSTETKDVTPENLPVTKEPINSESYGVVNIISFYLKDESKTYSPFLINENTIHVAVPHNSNLTKLIPVFSDNITVLSQNKQDFSDLVHPVEIKVSDENGIIGLYKIIIYDLPVLTITTPDNQDITSKDIRVDNCEVILISESNTEDLGTAGIKVRGNSTAFLEKKPYNIKFDNKIGIFGLQKSKKWVLLANAYYDRTQLHNVTAFEIARMTDFPWVQEGRFIELILNGEHKGLYYLCEKIEVEKGRININELKSSDISDDKITGGYLLETDVYDPLQIGLKSSEKYSFNTNHYTRTGLNGEYKCTLGYFLKNPDENVPDEQFYYIKMHLNKMADAINDFEINNTNVNRGGYKQYIDIETVIDWYLVEELCLNEEASRLKNMYLYKKRGDDKIYVGPPWDFDAWSFGFTGSKKNYIKDSGWCWNVLLSDSEFVTRLKEKWNTYKTEWSQKIPKYIDEQYELIHRAAERNEVIWDDWHPVNCYSEKSYYQMITEMKNAFNEQILWMDSEISGL